MKETVLITGANGQLGQCFKEISLKNRTVDFIFKDATELDITNLVKVSEFFKNNTINYCINCAAYTAVDNAEKNQDLSTSVNTHGPKNLAKMCNQYDVELIHVSTDFVFDGTSNNAYTETSVTNPLSVYGRTKLDGEKAICQYCDKYIIIRTSWLYSKYGHNFVKTMLRLATEKKEIFVVEDQIGSPTYAMDLACVILDIIGEDNKHYGIYHYCNQGVASWYDFAVAIFELTEAELSIIPIKTSAYPTFAKRPIISVLDTTKIKNTLGIKIPHWRTSLKQALTTI